MRRHVSSLLSNLRRENFEITLFAPPDFEPDTEAKDYRRETLSISAKTSLVSDAREIGRLANSLEGRFDLVHGHGLRGALYAVLAAKKAGIPSLFTAHNLISSPGILQSLTVRTLATAASACIAVSEAVKQSLIACGAPEKRISVISNGVDIASHSSESDALSDASHTLETFGFQPGTKPILGAGRLSPEKGFDILVRATPEVQRRFPEAVLVIAGSGPEAQNLSALATEIGANATFAGQVSDLPRLMRASRILVAPSRQEGQGLVALEGMACGIPVVASDVGGLSETIAHDRTGILFPVGDTAALSEILISLLNDPAKCKTLGEAGKSLVQSEYRLSEMISKTEALYQSIVVAKSHRR